ncbi:L,D-transpeptidase family protein [Tengunoibacter tsumagoiensis]|uniref:SH3b domain-containing protein n=1 Tax=Tengunoibacter tsumagoiensis TaxID=2014871 RepID=A0A401ZVW5_9CHLR|nr:L,D-transpeptidase family protein [Tengunoibacter tsumagoiensis]GCE10874.1 hypothetical protein KTT_07330 [Tengunoibacter tsumagoiensis]
MQKTIKKIYLLGPLALLFALILAVSPVANQVSHASPAVAHDTWTGKTTGWANVRSGANTNSTILGTDAPNTSVTVYGTVSGQVVWGNISDWYQISNGGQTQYIYAGLITRDNGGSTNQPVSTSNNNGGTATVTSWANVRSAPNTGSSIVSTFAPNTSVTIYDTVSGQAVWGGISTWYRVSASGSAPQYVYGGLVSVSSAPSTNSGNNTNTPAPNGSGKVIDVNLSGQWLRAYENGTEVYNTPVLTGRPELPTPTGTFHVFVKLSPTTFYSPWPVGSPYYYAPTPINYALEFEEGGYFLHDATWHSVFGPGSNLPHNDPVFGPQDGSHGCVTMPLSAAQWLYGWAPIGTTVNIHY